MISVKELYGPSRYAFRNMLQDDLALHEFLKERGVDLDSHEAVFQVIRTASLMVTAMEGAALRPLGLTHAGYRLMLELRVKGALEPHELAGFMTVTRPTIVGAVNTLVRAGLVVRSRAGDDRRRVKVSLTDQGIRLIDEADAAWRIMQKRVTQDLSADEKRELAELARRLGRMVDRLRDELENHNPSRRR